MNYPPGDAVDNIARIIDKHFAPLNQQLENQASIIRDTATPANEREVRVLRELADLRAQILALDADRKRLDWLEAHPNRTDMDFGNGPRGMAYTVCVDGKATIREAIDAAMTP